MKSSNLRLSAICAFCLALSFLLSACSFGAGSAGDGIVISSAYDGVATDDGYFMKSSDNAEMMAFYDFKTKQTVPLCNKPDCSHEDSDTCAAYVKTDKDNFVADDFIVYGDFIYYFAPNSFTEMSIIRTNLDNSNRITLASDNISHINRIVAVDNKIYYVCNLEIYEESDDISMNAVDSIASIHCFDLATNKVSVVVNPESDTERRIFYEGASKDYIYFLEMRLGDETEIYVDEFDGSEHEVHVRSEAKLKRLSLKTLEETAVADAMDICYDYGGYFVRKKGDTDFEVYELDYKTGELNELFTTDTVVGYVASDENRFMYNRDPGKSLAASECFVFDKRTKSVEQVQLSDANGEDFGFSCSAEHGDYFIGTVIYKDRQFRAMIKKDDLFSGNGEYESMQNNGF